MNGEAQRDYRVFYGWVTVARIIPLIYIYIYVYTCVYVYEYTQQQISVLDTWMLRRIWGRHEANLAHEGNNVTPRRKFSDDSK